MVINSKNSAPAPAPADPPSHYIPLTKPILLVRLSFTQRKQASQYGPNDHEDNSAGEGLSGEGGGEFVPGTAIRRTSIAGLLSQQVHDVNGLMVQMTAMTNVKLEAQSRCLEAYQSEIMAPMMGRNEEAGNSGRS